MVGWRVSGSLNPPFCTQTVCGQEEEGRQQECRNESWAGPVPTGWGGRARLPCGPTPSSAQLVARQPAQTAGTQSSPACVHAYVPVLGASLPQSLDGNPSGYPIVTVPRRPEDGDLSAATAECLLRVGPDPFISSFNPYNPIGRHPYYPLYGQRY